MAEKKESKTKWLDSAQKIMWITVAAIALLGSFFATYTNSLLSPIKHTQQYFDRELNEIVIKVNKMDDEVDENRHDIAIINVYLQRNK